MNVRNWSKKSSGLKEWKWLYGVNKLSTFTVRSWCNHVHSLYGVDAIAESDFTELMWLYTVQCTVKFVWLADFVFLLYVAQSRQSARPFLQSSKLAPQPQEMVSPLLWFRGGGDTLACGWGVHFTELMWQRKVTLRSKKIHIKWLSPVKVTLKVIKRHLLVFCWSCDVVPLKLCRWFRFAQLAKGKKFRP